MVTLTTTACMSPPIVGMPKPKRSERLDLLVGDILRSTLAGSTRGQLVRGLPDREQSDL